MELPSISANDWRRFHERNFPHLTIPAVLLSGNDNVAVAEVQHEVFETYPDGVRRTLTDEQIAMFRHSEVQALLKAHRLAQEAAAGSGSNTEHEGSTNPMSTAEVISVNQPRMQPSSNAKKRHKRKRKAAQNGPNKRPKAEEGDFYDSDAEKTYRRIARELDEQAMPEVELDY